MDALARQRFPEPYFVNDLTVERLDYRPVPLDDALRVTLDWLRATHLAGSAS